MLALAACAVLAGAKSLAAIAEWAADAPTTALTALGAPSREPTGPTAPAEATVRRILQRIDGDALDDAIGAWLAVRDPQSAQDAGAAEIAQHVRWHWGIENKIHHVRDTAWTEDTSHVTPAPPPGPWPVSATSPSEPSDSPGTPASPPLSAITHATPPDP
ncbi:transposase family protein [Streptomyces sp. NPDC002688]|uniref:transposase family protein n=1 Tax=Streptomyces sp. NPDC002688 TaxID=3154423 RepID=UPI0033343947